MKTLNVTQCRWVESTFSELSLRQKIAQLLAPMLTPDSAKPLSMPEFVVKTGVGAGHVFGNQFDKTREAIESCQAVSEIPLLLTGDFQVGPGERIRGATLFPTQMALGASDSEELAYAVGKAIATQAGAAGINWALEPIVDLAAVKDYQRQIDSFGRDPQQVARLAVAMIRGLQDHGMAATAKHFPGDGFDDRDQHIMTLVNPLNREEWLANSAVPFQAAIDAGVYSIMVSCIGLPGLDPDAGDPRTPQPAITSPYLLKEVLRKQLGFEGVIISDALNMGGVAYCHTLFERYARALKAGNDVLLFVQRVPELLDYLESLVNAGEISGDQVEQSCLRVLAMKAKLNLQEQRIPPIDAKECLANAEAQKDADTLGEKSITLVRDSKNLVPLNLEKGDRVAVVTISNQSNFIPTDLENTLREAGMDVISIQDPQTDALYNLVEREQFDAVITCLFFPIQFGWNTVRVHGPYARCLMSGYPLASTNGKAVWISFSTPTHLYELPFMDPYMVTYGNSASSQKAAAKALLGEVPIRGRVPMGLNDFFEPGDGVMRG